MRYTAHPALWEMLADTRRGRRTLRWLAHRVDCSPALLSRLKSHERTIDGDLAQRISGVLDVPVSLIFLPVVATKVAETDTDKGVAAD